MLSGGSICTSVYHYSNEGERIKSKNMYTYIGMCECILRA